MSLHQNLEKQAKRAILKKALRDWKVFASLSAATVFTILQALAIDGTGFAWVGALAGLSLSVVFFLTTLRNPSTGADAVADMLRETFKPEELHSRDLQAKLNEALDYYRKMMRLIEARNTDSMLTDELIKIADQMDEWVQEIYDLSQQIDNHRQENRRYAQTIRDTHMSIRTLESKLDQEEDELIREEIRRNLQSLRYKLQTLDKIEDTMTRALLMIDNQLTNMSTIYLQATLMDVKQIDSSRAQRLREEIATEVQEMDDILVTMAEIYESREQF